MEQSNGYNYNSGDMPLDPFDGEDISHLLVDQMTPDGEESFLQETLDPLGATADEKQILLSDPFGLSPEVQAHCVRLAYMSAYKRLVTLDGKDDASTKELLDMIGGWVICSEANRIGGPVRAAMALMAYDMYSDGACEMLWEFGHTDKNEFYGTVRFATKNEVN
jgi:hypothetical protein